MLATVPDFPERNDVVMARRIAFTHPLSHRHVNVFWAAVLHPYKHQSLAELSMDLN